MKVFPKRYKKVRKYIEKLVVSDKLQDILKEVEGVKSEVKRIYVDIHIFKEVKKVFRNIEVVSENKKSLKHKNLGVLVAFNILDLAMNRYKRRILKN